MVCVIMFITSIAILDISPVQREANAGVFTQAYTYLGTSARNYLTIQSLHDAVRKTNEQLSRMRLGDIETPIRTEECSDTQLVWDHTMGNIYYWKLHGGDLDVCIDAMTGEIIHYSRYSYNDGSLTQAQALDLGEQVASQFHPLPADRSDATIGPWTLEEANWSGWSISWNRMKDGILAQDHIGVILDPSGALLDYSKDWNMDLSELDTHYSVTERQAIETVLKEGYGQVNSVDKVIVRPTFGWDTDSYKYGTAPMCEWRVVAQEDYCYPDTYYVDSQQNMIVDAEVYC